MENKVTKRVLRKFLKSQGVSWRVFKHRVNEGIYTWKGVKSYLKLQTGVGAKDIFMISIIWIETPEGYVFWNNVHEQWNQLFKDSDNGTEENQ